MFVLLFSLLLTSPSYAKQERQPMPCDHVREVAQVVLEAPNLKERDKMKVLRRLFGTYGVGCISGDAND